MNRKQFELDLRFKLGYICVCKHKKLEHSCIFCNKCKCDKFTPMSAMQYLSLREKLNEPRTI